LIADTDLTLETIPNLRRTAPRIAGEPPRALALADDLIKQSKMTAAAVMDTRAEAPRRGSWGRSTTGAWPPHAKPTAAVDRASKPNNHSSRIVPYK